MEYVSTTVDDNFRDERPVMINELLDRFQPTASRVALGLFGYRLGVVEDRAYAIFGRSTGQKTMDAYRVVSTGKKPRTSHVVEACGSFNIGDRVWINHKRKLLIQRLGY